MIKKLLSLALLGLLFGLAVIAWLMFSPSRIDPVAWVSPTAPKLEGRYAPNHILSEVQHLAVGIGEGPEGVAVDADGRVYAGYLDGRVIELEADGASYHELANMHGRPLGIGFAPAGW